MAGPKIHELPEQDRPREKLARAGAGALSDSELIAILLRTGIPGCNAVELGRQLITRYGSLAALSRCTVAELAKIKGVGPAKAVQLAAALSAGRRLAKERLTRQRLDTPR
jgi:DNA repair protein RadC